MKIKITILAIVVIIIVIAALVSPRPVVFSLSEGIGSIYLTDSNGNTRYKDIQSNDTIWVAPGKYNVKTEDINFDSSDTTVSVPRSLQKSEFSIDMPYTQGYLNSLTEEVTVAAQKLLQEKYGAVMDNYTIIDAQLFGQAEWYGAVLFNKSSTINDKKDYFRFIMKRDDKEWRIIHKPSLVIDKNFQEVPKDIAKTINNIRHNY